MLHYTWHLFKQLADWEENQKRNPPKKAYLESTSEGNQKHIEREEIVEEMREEDVPIKYEKKSA